MCAYIYIDYMYVYEDVQIHMCIYKMIDDIGMYFVYVCMYVCMHA